MNSKIQKEIPLILIVLIPFIYLAVVWNELPDKVPLHWNIEGEIDRYGEKHEILMIPLLLPLATYLLLSVIPKIDPKGKIKSMGKKYHTLKTWITVLTSALAVVLIYASMHQSLYNPNYMILLIGILFTLLGNYFKTLRPNYFIGIKTPWALENETVWNETHKLAGKLWFAGGLVIILGSLFLDKKPNFSLFMTTTIIIAAIPIIYSYVKYKSLTNV